MDVKTKFSNLAVKSLSVAFLSAALMLSLPHTTHAIGKRAKGPDVYVVQRMLKSLGSYEGPFDGYYGASLIKVVKYYQKTHGLKVTGNVDAQTMESISYSYVTLKSGGGKSRAKAGTGVKGIGGGAGGGVGGAGVGEGAGKGPAPVPGPAPGPGKAPGGNMGGQGAGKAPGGTGKGGIDTKPGAQQ